MTLDEMVSTRRKQSNYEELRDTLQIKMSGQDNYSIDEREAASSSFEVEVNYHSKKQPSLWQRELNAKEMQKI